MLVKNAPNTVIAICGTVVLVAIIGAGTALALQAHDATKLTGILTAIFSGLSILLGTGSFLYAGVGAKKSDENAQQLQGLANGQLTAKINAGVNTALTSDAVLGKMNEAIKSALIAHDKEVHGIDIGPVPPTAPVTAK